MSDTQDADIVMEAPQEPAGQVRPEEVFLQEYNELCKKHKFQIAVVPNWVPRDDGSWSTVLKTGVSKLNI